MVIDSYSILGLSPGATKLQIRQAYRALAKSWHPDQLDGDATRFHQLRRAYDRLMEGIEKTNQAVPIRQFNFLSRFTRKSKPQAAPAPRQTLQLHIALEDLIKGVRRQVTLPDGQAVELQIPKGHSPNCKLPLARSGSSGASQFDVQLRIKPDQEFQLRGRDLHTELYLGLWAMRVGETVNLKTPVGTLAISIPVLSGPGRTLRLLGKGLPACGSAAAGDLYISLQVKAKSDFARRVDQFAETFARSARSARRT